MKAERRHELHRDPFADWIVDTSDRVKPYARAIVGVLVAVLVLVGVYLYFNARENSRRQVASEQFLTALSTGDRQALEQAIRDNEGTDLGVLSRLALAQAQLDQGTNQIFTDKAAGTQSLREAASDFAQVKDLTHDPLLRAWAIFGVGLARESLNELDAAREAYKQLVDTYPDSTFTATAKQRLQDLEKPQTKAFYDWFASQNPVPQSRLEPGIPGQTPSFDITPPTGIAPIAPGADSVNLPSNLEGTVTPSADLPKLPQPGDDSKKTDSPPSETSAPDSKADSKPAEPAPEAPKSETPQGEKS